MSLLASLNEFDEQGGVGDWCFSDGDQYLIIRLHAGDDGVAAILVKPDPEVPDKKPWSWDGDRESPTLEPSILHHSRPEWHGWLRNGKLVNA